MVAVVAAFPALVGAIVLAHWDALHAAVLFWSGSFNYKYGALLTIIVLAIATYDLAVPRQRDLRVRPILLVATLGATTLLSISSLATVLVFQMALLIIVPWLSICVVFGWSAAQRLILPFSLALIAVPVWDFLIGPLQKTTIAVVNYLLDVLRRTSYVDGDLVILRYGSFHVEEGCSGMNFFVAGIMLSGLYAFWFLSRWQSRLIAILVGGGAAILANWVRVFVIVMAGDLSHMQHSLVDEHIGFGWVIFGLVMGSLLLLEHRLTRSAAIDDVRIGKRNDVGAGSANLARWLGIEKSTLGIALTLVAIVLPAAGIAIVDHRAGSPQSISISLAADQVDATQIANPVSRIVSPEFVDARARLSATYRIGKDAREIQVEVNAYDLRDREAELVGYPNRWFDPGSWTTISTKVQTISNDSLWPGATLRVLQSTSGSYATVTAYYFDGTMTGDDVAAKVIGVKEYLGGNYIAAAVVISMRCEVDCSTEAAILESLATSIGDNKSLSFHVQ